MLLGRLNARTSKNQYYARFFWECLGLSTSRANSSTKRRLANESQMHHDRDILHRMTFSTEKCQIGLKYWYTIKKNNNIKSYKIMHFLINGTGTPKDMRNNKKTTKTSQASSCACFMVPLRFWLWDPLLGPMIVEVGTLSHYLQGFSTIPGGDRRISEPSTSINHGMISGHPPQTIFGYLSTSSIICAQKKQSLRKSWAKDLHLWGGRP